MNKEKIKKQLEYWEFVTRYKIIGHRRKTITSIIRDCGKNIETDVNYSSIKKVYNAIKVGCETRKEIEVHIKQDIFRWTSYTIQYLLLRGIIDRHKRGKKYYYKIINTICNFNPKYQRLLFKRW